MHPDSLWTIEDALLLVRELQPVLKPLKYHLALGGGVLNTGVSSKDLDLYFLPFSVDAGEPDQDASAVLKMLEDMWGYHLPIVTLDPAYLPQQTIFKYREKFDQDGIRIDVFIA